MIADSMITARDIFDCALAPLDEGDRHFGDAASLPRRDEQHLDQERIAVGDEPVERQRASASRRQQRKPLVQSCAVSA